MKLLKLFTLLIVFIGLAWNCRNPTGANKQSSIDNKTTSDTLNQPHRPLLPSLETGEIHLKDEVFGNIINLTGTPLNFKEIIKPEQLLVKGKYLITNNQRQDSVFMIFELPDMKCVTAFGIKGRGPDEFSFPRIVETTEDSILFYIYEVVNEKIYKVALNYLKPKYFLTLPKHNKSFDDKQIVFFDDKTAFYSASTAKGKMIYYFNKDSIPQVKPFKDLSISGIKGSWTTFIGDFGINKNYERIVYAYKYYKRLRIIDIKTKSEKNVIFEEEGLVKGLNDVATLEPTNITHFWGMSPKEEFFWMLYSGRTPIDVMRDNQKNNKYIFVEKYDWNGNPIKKFKLDDWGYFCIDDKNETLYLASTASANAMLKYKLSDF
jgi:hypothetical protein